MSGTLTQPLSERHAGELARLVRMVRLSAGRHSFAVVECNSPALRESLLGHLAEELPGLRVIRVTKETYSILDTVVAELGADRPPAVVIEGIETMFAGVERNEPALSRLNYSRDGWREELACPSIFWLPTFAAIALTRDCGDLQRMITTWYTFEAEASPEFHRSEPPRQESESTTGSENEECGKRSPNSFAGVPLRPESRRELEEFEAAFDRGDMPAAERALKDLRALVGAGIVQEGEDGDSWDRLAYFESAARLGERTNRSAVSLSDWTMATRIADALVKSEGSLASYRHASWNWRRYAENAISHGLSDKGAEALERARQLLDQGLARHTKDPSLGGDWRDFLLEDLARTADDFVDWLVSRGNTQAALDILRVHLESRLRLSREQPDNRDYQRDLSVSYIKMGDLYVSLGDVGSARDAFQKSLDIRKKLSEAKPTRADYQRNLSVTYERMGDLYVSLGDGGAARDAFQKSLDIRKKLSEAEPARADYQRDLSVSYERMGDLYVSLGDGGAARDAFQKSLEIRKKLSEAEPARADYQRDLFVSYYKLGTVDPARGRPFFEQSLQILLQLEAVGRLNPADRPHIEMLRKLAAG